MAHICNYRFQYALPKRLLRYFCRCDHFWRNTNLIGFYFFLALICIGSVSQAAELSAEHNLHIELFPKEKKLTGTDDITIKAYQSDTLAFELSRRIKQINVEVNKEPRKFSFENGTLNIQLTPHETNREIQIRIHYSAIFDDPVPLRPVNTDNPGFGVSATISERGCFLLPGSGWYPEFVEGRANYKLEVVAPAGMIAVTAGESRGYRTENGKTVSTWVVDYPVRGLSLSVGTYIVREKKVDTVTAATYFLPETDHLANSYLEATANYLRLYSDLFGPYPFNKFAVVENFFPTGFGFPSYTLIGGVVLRLPFIIHTSLGHEIAHCWWGNGVYVDYKFGNWSEALTTYVADYLYKEMRSNKDAQNYRLQISRNYTTLVKPQNDFALNQFQRRYDAVTKTVGYDKGAMIFHMLRQSLGEDAFWGALRDLYQNRLFKVTSWSDFQKAFETRAKRSLQSFFDQWVSRKGVPQFYLDAVQSEHSDGVWKTEGRILQEPPYFDLNLKIELQSGKERLIKQIQAHDRETPFQIVTTTQPQRLIADPNQDILRRLFRSEVPPSINALKSSTSVLALLSDGLDPEVKKAAEILVLSLGLKHCELAVDNKVNPEQLLENDILIIGYPRNKGILDKLPDQVRIQKTSFILNKALYSQSSDVFFGVFPHPFEEDRVVALFLPLSSQQVEDVARKITHYGKYSYLAFQNGKNRDKGFWQIEKSPLVYQWNTNVAQQTSNERKYNEAVK